MLVVSMACFGAASCASSLSAGITSLTWLRFLTGLGLGGAMPTAITLTSEYSPTPRRSSLVTLMFCGFTIGSAIGGLAAAQVITAYGWRPLFVAGGVVPLLLSAVLWRTLPESVRYLASLPDGAIRARRILRQVAPGENLDGVIFTGGVERGKSPVVELFAAGLRGGTVLFWLSFFMSLLVVYLLSNWMPTLMQRSGVSLRGASLITAMFQIGGTLGAVVLGWLMDRLEPHATLGVAYLVGAACVALVGAASRSPSLMAAAVFGAGFSISGGQVGANALAAAFYPTACRTTGVSAALGAGRSGSIVGSLIGATMLAQGWGFGTVYGMVAVPAVISAAAILVLGALRKGPRVSQGAKVPGTN
jgi:AAHS family 4-hydroxybenzoate transporter-like MFS transporter